MPGITRRCPICHQRITEIETDWILQERTLNGHRVATIGTTHNAPAHLQAAAQAQIGANLAAYSLDDHDAILNLGFLGTAWIQCPQKRDHITTICFPT